MKPEQVKPGPFVILLNNRGFTLIEMLISLAIFIVIASLVLEMVTAVQSALDQDDRINPKEWEVFRMQLNRQVYLSTSQKLSGGRLYLTIQGEVVTIEQYQNKIRRRINGAGHDVMLQHALSFSVTENQGVITVTAADKAGNKYTASVIPFVKMEPGA